jgi:hypothetical protein
MKRNPTSRWVDFKTTHQLDGCNQNIHMHVHQPRAIKIGAIIKEKDTHIILHMLPCQHKLIPSCILILFAFINYTSLGLTS